MQRLAQAQHAGLSFFENPHNLVNWHGFERIVDVSV
jgi:hypothetical protein